MDKKREELRQQVGAQCNAVAVMAEALARVHHDYAAMLHDGHSDALLEQIGQRSAELMEELGDILNGMDAVSDEDAWMEPVFEKAHQMFPQAAQPGHCITCMAAGTHTVGDGPHVVTDHSEQHLEMVKDAAELLDIAKYFDERGKKSNGDFLRKIAASLSQAAQPVSEQNARFAIDGAITYGRQGINKPPSEDHWLMPYWQIGRQLAAQPAKAAPGVPSDLPAWSQLGNALKRHSIQELLAIYDECNGDWCRIARQVEEGVIKKSSAVDASPSVASERDAVDAQKVRDDVDLAAYAKEALRELAHIENHLERTKAPETVRNRTIDLRSCINDLIRSLQSQPASAGKDAEDARRLDAMENMTPDECFAIIEDACKDKTLRAAIDNAIAHKESGNA